MEEGYEAAIKIFYQQGVEKGECVKLKLDGICKDDKWSYKTSEERYLKSPEDQEKLNDIRKNGLDAIDVVFDRGGLTANNYDELEKQVVNVKQKMLVMMPPKGPRKIPEEYNNNICILRGKSPRGDFGHVVVAKHITDGKFEMLHDPHPDETFLDIAEAYGWCLFFV